jgi:hypothetical protein
MKTLLLDQTAWDLVLDVSGNIAVASDPYAMAQDAASAIRTFLGETWYDTRLGVPYFQSFMGRAPNVALMKAKFADVAVTVPGVVSAKVFITSISERQVTGQVQVTDSSGQTSTVAF